jgi:branched-chain amino acid transport system permease protein
VNLHEFEQLVASGIIQGSMFGLLGAGFGLIFGITGRFHFAYSSSYALAAYLAIELQLWGAPLGAAIAGGIVAGILLGMVIERWIYQPMADRLGPASPFTIFVASLGITIVVANGINLIWGGEGQALNGIPQNPIRFGGVSFTSLDLAAAVLGWILVLGLEAFLRRTQAGRIISAVRVNPQLARGIGIRPRHVHLWVFAIGTALGAVAAIYQAAASAATPDMGAAPLFDAFLVVFLAGYTRPPVVLMATGVGIGLVQNLSQLWVPAAWSPVVIFSVLLVYLILKAIGVDRFRPAPRLAAGEAR